MAFDNVMLDIETGGLHPDKSPIIQIGALRFDLVNQKIDPDSMFLVNVQATASREFDESTKEWWSENPARMKVYTEICQNAVPAADAMEQLRDWGTQVAAPRFWSKHTHMDYAFIESYFWEFKIRCPWLYKDVTDIDSFIYGLQCAGYAKNLTQPELNLPAHNALGDCLWQTQYLFGALQ